MEMNKLSASNLSSFELESRYYEKYMNDLDTSTQGKFNVYINALNCFIPVVCLGILTVPYCFYETGFVYGLVTVLIISIFNIMTNMNSYHEIGNVAYGRNSIFIVSCANSLFGIGMSLSYFIVLADIIAPVLQNMFGTDEDNSDYRFYAIVLISASLAYFCIQKQTNESKIGTILTTLCICIFCLVLWVYYIDTLSQQERNMSDFAYPEVSIFSYFKVIPIILVAFCFQPSILSSHKAFSVEKKGNIWKIITTAYAVSPICYLLIVTFALVLYGPDLQTNLFGAII